jgi:DNA-directed RNA polymerase subunit H (RpoH/RPB5)
MASARSPEFFIGPSIVKRIELNPLGNNNTRMPTTEEVLKIMLQQRGVNTSAPETIDTDFPATTVKYGDTLVFMSNRTRITEDQVLRLVTITQEHGGKRGIVVVPIPPSETIMEAVSAQSQILQIFHTGQLIFDITTHRAVPRHRILGEEEVKSFLEKFGISLDAISKKMQSDHIQLKSDEPLLPQMAMKHKEYMPTPHIWSQDAPVRWIGGRPGDIIEVLRKSPDAGATPYYRFCVATV